jgi:hypothetical protein
MAALVGSGGRRMRAALARYRSLRVYTVHAADAARVRELVGEYFTGVEQVEFVRADVCRRTLLVEIEATADGAGLA